MAANTEILTYINTATGYQNPVVQNVLEAFKQFISLKLRQGEQVRIEGFGKFFCKELEERQGRNPRTGETITVPAKKKPKMKFFLEFERTIQGTVPESIPESIPASIPASAPEPAPALTPVTALHAPGTETSTRKMPPPPPPEMMAKSKTWFVPMGGDANKLEEVAESELPKYAGRSTAVWSEQTGWKLIRDLPELAYLFPDAA